MQFALRVPVPYLPFDTSNLLSSDEGHTGHKMACHLSSLSIAKANLHTGNSNYLEGVSALEFDSCWRIPLEIRDKSVDKSVTHLSRITTNGVC